MIFQIYKLILYITSIMLSMWALTCFNFDSIILKGKLRQFYFFYFITSICMGYLLTSFILEFMTIHF